MDGSAKSRTLRLETKVSVQGETRDYYCKDCSPLKTGCRSDNLGVKNTLTMKSNDFDGI